MPRQMAAVAMLNAADVALLIVYCLLTIYARSRGRKHAPAYPQQPTPVQSHPEPPRVMVVQRGHHSRHCCDHGHVSVHSVHVHELRPAGQGVAERYSETGIDVEQQRAKSYRPVVNGPEKAPQGPVDNQDGHGVPRRAT